MYIVVSIVNPPDSHASMTCLLVFEGDSEAVKATAKFRFHIPLFLNAIV